MYSFVHSSLLNFTSTTGLCQFVRFATQSINDQSVNHLCGDNVLDLVLANYSQIINSRPISPGPPVGHSDHVLINFTLGLQLYAAAP